MGFNWSNAGQGAAGGAATGGMMGASAGGIGALPGAAIGAILGGIAGGFSGSDEQKIPDFNAAERAREYMRSYGGWQEKLGSVGASADSLGRRTAAELISAGVDPVSAQNIATRRAASAREAGAGDLIQSAGSMEAQLAGNLLPMQFQREEDQISLANMKANEPTVLESFIPMAFSAFGSMNSSWQDASKQAASVATGVPMGGGGGSFDMGSMYQQQNFANPYPYTAGSGPRFTR